MFLSLHYLLLLVSLAAQAPPPIENRYAKGLPATLAGFEDEAKLIIIVGEDRIGTMTSSWRKDGSYTATAELTVAGQKVIRSTSITPDADGRWKEIRLTLPTGTLDLKRDGVSATREFQGKTSTLETRGNSTFQDVSSLASYAHTLRRYDQARGGEQKFPDAIQERPDGAGGPLLGPARLRIRRSGLPGEIWKSGDLGTLCSRGAGRV